MRRAIFIGLALMLVAFAGFYVAWPAWTGYRIAQSFGARDQAALARVVDFDSVRTTLTPVVNARVGVEIDARVAKMGPLAQALAPKLKSDMAPKIADLALANLVTPEAFIRIASEGGSIKDSIERMMAEVLSKMGGIPGQFRNGETPDGTMPSPATLGGIMAGIGLRDRTATDVPASGAAKSPSAPAAASAPIPAPSKFGIANIKSFAITGLASFAVGVNRDAFATEPEVTAEMAFRGGDWRLVGIFPKL